MEIRNSENDLSLEEARLYLNRYIKAVFDFTRTDKTNYLKIIVHSDMFLELTKGFKIPKGHRITFNGLPLQHSELLPYGTIILVSKLQTVDVCVEKEELKQ